MDADRRPADHGTTHEAPIVRFERDERAALRPLPLRALPRRDAAPATTRRARCLRRRRHRPLQRAASTGARSRRGRRRAITVRIFHGAELVATHAAIVEPYARVVDPAHYAGLWRTSAGRRRAAAALARLGRDLDDYAAVVDGGQ